MNFTLKRTSATKFGVFGQLEFDGTEELYCMTLEHAYPGSNGTFVPKIPTGIYRCVKGSHQLHSMDKPFIAFELQDVPGHSNILIHMGNYNSDSEGCILVGKKPAQCEQGRMIASSVEQFKSFMQLQSACSEFMLTIK